MPIRFDYNKKESAALLLPNLISHFNCDGVWLTVYSYGPFFTLPSAFRCVLSKLWYLTLNLWKLLVDW